MYNMSILLSHPQSSLGSEFKVFAKEIFAGFFHLEGKKLELDLFTKLIT